eukprot:CAMPEP_0119484468 /NCGR_PEP_ID=MMETSP1344-20130328/11472_1 /TAXON_ID=236787 /ORGANISM="Florenciella parvula, Strain CCMP2471" /LENGTH=90 /DNA_ID=CAMNT_0007519055 /DNA_START=51 /DNA_END=323 /DNA_ORIENTATION=-
MSHCNSAAFTSVCDSGRGGGCMSFRIPTHTELAYKSVKSTSKNVGSSRPRIRRLSSIRSVVPTKRYSSEITRLACTTAFSVKRPGSEYTE